METLSITENKLHVSKGNTKIGKTINVSLTPGVNASCAGCGEVCIGACYADKAQKRYPSAREAWADNFRFALSDLNGYFEEIAQEVKKEYYKAKKKARKAHKKTQKITLRMHVAGEIPNYKYFVALCNMAEELEGVANIYIYTKRYNFVNYYIYKKSLTTGETPTDKNNWLIPSALCVRFSEWNHTAKNPYGLPVFEFVDKDYERPEGLYCPAVLDNGKGKKGKMNHEIHCDKCGLCKDSSVKQIYVLEH